MSDNDLRGTGERGGVIGEAGPNAVCFDKPGGGKTGKINSKIFRDFSEVICCSFLILLCCCVLSKGEFHFSL